MNINTKIILQIIFAVSLLFLIYCLLTNKNFNGKSVKEGITFTEYDKRMLFTRPWNSFCVSPPPSWSGSNFIEKPAVLGLEPVGNWCKNVGSATSPPEISDDCIKLTTNHFYESINPEII